jgi:hypothetical protein
MSGKIEVKILLTSNETKSLLFSHVDDLRFADSTNIARAWDSECRSLLQNNHIPNGHLLIKSTVTHKK